MSNTITPDILEALRRGDHKAFETVFIAYFSKVKVFIGQLIRSEEDAEELTQELFLRIWANRTAIEPHRSFSAYLYKMARNGSFNYIKHTLVAKEYVDNYIPLTDEPGPDELMYAKEIALLIDMALNKMPEQRKRIFEMSRYQGMSNEAIAEKLTVSKKTVENQMSLAIKELRKTVLSFSVLFM